MDANSDLVRWTDIAFKWAVIAGPIVWGVLFSYLKTMFVTKIEFEKLHPRIEGIERTVLLMANQQKVLDDHEDRLRYLEKKYSYNK